MAIHYYFSNRTLGEPWTKWSFMQLLGMFVLLYGTSIYNAPNAGSLLLKGQWYALGIDLRDEYQNASFEEATIGCLGVQSEVDDSSDIIKEQELV